MNCFASEDELNEYESYIEVRRENIKYRDEDKEMKNYKEFEKISLGGSDGAAIIMASYPKLEYLFFGGDGKYKAYFINEEIELPAHYTKQAEFENWVRIYDDDERMVTIEAKYIEIYRSGEFGCLIYAPGGRHRY